MSRFWSFLTDVRVLGVIGFVALAAFLLLGASALQVALVYAAIALGLALLVWLTVWIVKKVLAYRAGQRIEQAMGEAADGGRRAPAGAKDADIIATRMRQAVKTIKSSRLGETAGSAALYELPWYIVIGNPAAGKSSAVVQSGLQFPFADKAGSVVQGIGGTRNCDWFFTNEGILLDTAGRYSVHEEDRSEWLGFLSQLKKQRPKAPINGILIAASLAELANARPDAAILLAKNLRQRVQELTETLEVIAPVYLMFTKADLVSGFSEFFEDRDGSERAKVWGATLPYAPTVKADAVAQFDEHFDELFDGLKELSVARMSLHRGQALPPGVLTFPLEFAAMKPALRAFIATLFEENPYQFPPVFRGFYFTSALQEGTATSRASEHVAAQFALDQSGDRVADRAPANNGYFLKDLFSKVIFADRNLVKQHTSRNKMKARVVAFGVAVLVLGLALSGWTWSYLGNRQLMSNVQADLNKAVRVQKDRTDLASRFEALETLQDRIEQLDAYRNGRPMTIGLGLYQGEAIEAKLRQEYFFGVRQLMMEPVAQALEGFLVEVNQNAAQLQPMIKPPTSGAPSLTAVSGAAAAPAAAPGLFVGSSPTNVQDAYAALKTYLMLADRSHLDAGHLNDQVTRFWRGWLEANRGTMPREQMIGSAERMVSFTLTNLQDSAFPLINDNLSLVDTTRGNLQRVMRGMAARDRVYTDVMGHASQLFKPMTVARIVAEADRTLVVGSVSVPGQFTREAWEGYIENAFKEAATKELQSADWVLKTAARDDLSLEGSPEEIRKGLTNTYKNEYVQRWQQFVQGISIAEFPNFEIAAERMNRLGDPGQSPIKKVMQTIYDQTSWDNPSLLNERLATAKTGVIEWFKSTVLRSAPSQVDVKLDIGGGKVGIPMGPIGREFEGLSRLMMARDNSPTQMSAYLEMLSKLRTRFNQIKNQGDPGPGLRQLMVSTFGSSGSELAEGQRFVDEQMMSNMTDSARATLRPFLLRPFVQAFQVIIAPTEADVNSIWNLQVQQPFQNLLAAKYPFDPAAKIEAGPGEIAKIFGPDGAVAKFSNDTLTPLTNRKGDTFTPKAWGNLGVRIRPEFATGFANWVAPLEGGAAGSGGTSGGGGAAAANASQTVFQILPQGAPGLLEYTIEIDGQKLRYRNAAAEWSQFVWPNAGAVPGARITAITYDNRAVDILNEPGNFALTRMFEVAKRRQLSPNLFELTWANGATSLSVQLRIISQPGMAAPAPAGGAATPAPVGATGLKGARLPNLVLGVDAAVPSLPAPSLSAPAGPAAPVNAGARS